MVHTSPLLSPGAQFA